MTETEYKICPSCDTRALVDHRFCPSCGADLSDVAASQGDPYLGRTIAERYRITDLVGTGAMGRVYRAEQVTLNKSFAMKVLHSHLTGDPDSQARFENEAHNAASLNHPNVVSVVDYGRTEDSITYIVMEYVDGMSLEQIIQDQFPLGRDRILDLCLQVLAALAEAHGLGILHRDLKPENILVQTLRTHGELLKVLDFGIAKLMDNAPNQARPGVTGQGMVCGTPEYMSPEQARGFKLDGRSDLYAVGVILYQMLAGRVPFYSDSAVEILHKHIREEPVPPSKVSSGVPPALEAVCLKAISKDRNERYETAEAFRDALVAASREEAPSDRIRCGSCGSQMKSDDRFCASCGTPVPSRGEAEQNTRRATRLSLGNIPAAASEGTAETVVRSFPMPLVGRNDFLESAHKRLSQPPQELVAQMLRGPRGSGKTRLLDEIGELAQSMGWAVHSVGADPSGAAPPLWPIRSMVAGLLGIDPATVRTQDLGRASNLVGLSFEALPGLAELFQLKGPASEAEYAVRRRECVAAAVQTLTSGGRGNPLLLCFDDIDRFDAISRQIVQRLARAPANTPVIVLVASSEKDLSWLQGPVHELEPLDADDIEASVTKVAAGFNPDSNLPQELSALGPMHPLRIELVLRLLALGITPDPKASDQDLIRARLEILTPQELQIAEVATVLGTRFNESELVRLLGSDAGSVSGWELDEGLSRLHTTGVLPIAGRGERCFGSQLIRDVISNGLKPNRARTLHREAARTTERAKLSVTVRAMHLLRGGDPEVVDTLEQAAKQAQDSFDDRKSVSLLRAALRACAHLPIALRNNREAELSAKLANVLRFTRAAEEAVKVCKRAIERADPSQSATLQRSLGQAQFAAGDYQAATDSLQRAMGPLIAGGDRSDILGLYSELGRAFSRAGDPDRAMREMKEGLDMCTLGEGPRAAVDLDLWRYLLAISQMMRRAQKGRDARTWAEHALFQAERTKNSLGLMRCHAEMAWILRELEQSMLAEQHLARALEQARYFGDRLTTAEILLERGRARAQRGEVQDARRFFDEAQRLTADIDWREGMIHAKRALETLEQPTPDGERTSA